MEGFLNPISGNTNYTHSLTFSSLLSATSESLLLLSLSIIFISIIHLKLFKKYFFKNKHFPRLPPGPSPWPVLGCVPEMWRNRLAYRWIHRFMRELDTDIACVRLGNSHVIAGSSPEIAREFLKKHDAVFASRPVTMATRILSHGFITTGVVPLGEQWRKMRRVLVSEVFNQSRVRWLLDKRNVEADNLVRFLYNQCSRSFTG